jgi:transposase-like protein
MGKKCPRCKSSNTEASAPKKMFCKDCGHEWTPYKHSGKKMKLIGDGFITSRKRIMPGARTRTVGDGILFAKKRVKKIRKRKTNLLGFP